jgi:type IV secretion system protein VirB9
MRISAFAFLLACASAAQGQLRPQPGSGSPHLQFVDYGPDQVVSLQAAPGYQVTVELAPDERIENVAVGDSGAWQVTANHRGDRLFIKAVQPGITTNMVVVTDARVYSFDLVPLFSAQADMAYIVRFRYPSDKPSVSGPLTTAEIELGRYRVRGSDTLKPNTIHDDGVHTYIDWPADQPLPAIYAMNAQGQEMLVNGNMRDGVMVLDSVQPNLVFRIDGKRATATRMKRGKS